MELKVWVDDGHQRLVCGIGPKTTCQEVIYALAHATGKTGRFVLVEKWRTSQRSLSPHDKPLELVRKWGEYANDVQFVLRCLAPVPADSKSKFSSGDDDDASRNDARPPKLESSSSSSRKRESASSKLESSSASRKLESSSSSRKLESSSSQKWESSASRKLKSSSAQKMESSSSSRKLESALPKLESASPNLELESRKLESSTAAHNDSNFRTAAVLTHFGYNRRPVPPAAPRRPVGRPPPPSYEETMRLRRSGGGGGSGNYAKLAGPPQSCKPMAMVEAMKPVMKSPHESPTQKLSEQQHCATASVSRTAWPASREELIRILHAQSQHLEQQEEKLRRVTAQIKEKEQCRFTVPSSPPTYLGSLDRRQPRGGLKIDNRNSSFSSVAQENDQIRCELSDLAGKIDALDRDLVEKQRVVAEFREQLLLTDEYSDWEEENDSDEDFAGKRSPDRHKSENVELDETIRKIDETIQDQKKTVVDLELKRSQASFSGPSASNNSRIVSLTNFDATDADLDYGELCAASLDVSKIERADFGSMINETTPGVWV